MTDQAPTPNPDLRALDRLIGTWAVSDGAEGTVTYEWMEGGFFLIQRFDLMHEGHQVEGVDIIGHLQPFGEEPSLEIHSRAYDNVGNTLDYVYEIDGDTLIMWAGAKGSPAYFKGRSATMVRPTPASGSTRMAEATSQRCDT